MINHRNKLSRRLFTSGTAAVGAAAMFPSVVRAQAYPSQDVHFVCAFPAGSGADLIVRWYAEKLRPLFGRTIIVENRIGALGNVATQYTARSKPDGLTIYVHSAGALAANMQLFKKPPVDVAKEITVCAAISRQPTFLCVDQSKPWKSVAEVTAFAKERGDKVTYGTSNPMAKVMGAIYKELNKLEAVEVVYRSAADSMNDLKSGILDYALYDNIFGASQSREGRVRILAVSSNERLQANPDIATMTELGTPMNVTGWFSAMVPSATPRPIVEQINKLFNQVTATPEAKQFLNSVASDPWVITPDEARDFFHRDIRDWVDYVRIAKIEPQG
ncbi:MAG: Tripartite-type tricarboxylate transporter, receptor component TctC [Rhizobium sp.]|nr:Tripartite-type tricarboxylate transporter, receptor component TctC [Rhizobium sp.]